MHGRVLDQFPANPGERTITNVRDRKADAAARQAASFEFSPQIVLIFSARWQMGMPSCPRRRKRTPPAFGPSTRPYGGGVCSHQHAAQVHDGAVIKFPKIPSKEEIIISVNEPQADAASCAKKEKLHSSKKKEKLHIWVSHQAAGHVVFRRGITLGHPQPATNDPMNRSLASNVVSSSKVAKTVSVHLHTSYASGRSRRAKHEGPRWNLRGVVMATKDALNITVGKRTRRMTRTSDAQHCGGRELSCEWRDSAVRGFGRVDL